MNALRIIVLLLVLSALPADALEVVTPASNTDPLEIRHERSRHLKGLQENRKPLVDFEDLTGWSTVSYEGHSEGRLYRSQVEPLWGDYTARLTLKAGEKADAAMKKVIVRPPAPIPIDKSFDGINIWFFGDYWGPVRGPKIAVEVEDAAGKVHSLPLESPEHPFAFWSGWYLWHRTLPEKIHAPAKFLSLTFHSFDGKQEENIYLDSLDFYAVDHGRVPSNIPSWRECDFPTTPDTILPALEKGVKYTNSVRRSGNTVRLLCRADAETVEYIYRPETGTLSDVTVVHNGKTELRPAVDGGWVLEHEGKTYHPGDPAVTRSLQSLSVNAGGVRTKWLWKVGGLSFTTWMDLTIRQKSLLADVRADSRSIKEFRCGRATGANDFKLVEAPYLVLMGNTHESVDPGILYADGVFASAFLDWYNSDASELFGERKSEDSSAIMNGGSVYYPRTDGKRNTPRERLFITVSSKFSEVLPSVPNPPNPWNAATKSDVWATRMWYVSTYPQPDYYDREYAFWEKLRNYGVERMNIRFHVNLYRMYINRNGDPYTYVTDTVPQIGGDEKCAEAFAKIQDGLGYRVGMYTNYTLLGPLAYYVWDENLVALDPQGEWKYGSLSAAQTKHSRILDLQPKFAREMKRKFDPRCSYLDQYTCPPLWRYVDYDARVEDAGKFSPVLRVFAKSLREESRIFGGPVISEGYTQWMLSGFTDSYAQPRSPDQDTLLDFQLSAPHLLSNDCGFHLEVVASSKPEDVDKLLAAQIAYGHIGHIFGCYGDEPPKVTLPILKSYFMVQQLQQYYANEPVSMIRYFHNGKLLPIEQAIPADAVKNNQVYVRYENGLKVCVNRNSSAMWAPFLNGKQYALPPHGYVAELPGEILEYSILADGRRVDYVSGPQYTFCNGGGREFDFGPVRASGSYVIRRNKAGLSVIPAPFEKPETVSLEVGKSPVTITAFGESGERLSSHTATPDAAGWINLDIDGKAFRYSVE